MRPHDTERAEVLRVLLSILGISVILAAAVTVCAKYSAYERKRLSECEGFLLLLRHLLKKLPLCLRILYCLSFALRDLFFSTVELYIALRFAMLILPPSCFGGLFSLIFL